MTRNAKILGNASKSFKQETQYVTIWLIDLMNILCQQNKVNFTCITINATVSGDHCTLQRNENIFIKKQIENKDEKA